ncbi:CoA transferase [Amycolatopsis sp. AA4]|nr:CoA transferase [Amycolatopsis sp. AA4]
MAAPAGPLLTGATARVSGTSATARVLRRHLAAFGAEVTASDEDPHGLSAAAEVGFADGRRREITVSWAGPVREPALAGELDVQAVCGVMHVNGRRHGTARPLAVDYCATSAGVLAMIGLLASLRTEARESRVDTSVAEAGLLSVSQYLAAASAEDSEAVGLGTGGPPFVSADGVRFEIETLQPEPWAAFWNSLGAGVAAIRTGWRPFQFRYATATAPLPDDLRRAPLALPYAAIREIGARTGVSVCPVHTSSPPLPESPWQLEPTAGAARPSPAGTAASPLHGLAVLEAGRRIQAPLAAHLLRLLGTDVTRIEPPGGDPLRGMPPCAGGLSARWLALNRDKAAVELDIKSPADRDRLRELAADADVFLHNWAPGKAEELGLGARDFPGGLVYAYTSGWADCDGPDLPPGTDFMVQARSGLSAVAGTDGAPSLMTVLDVLGGLLGAETIAAALLERDRRGAGVAAESSLFGAAAELLRTGRAPARPAPVLDVTEDLSILPADPRMAAVIGRDAHGCPALHTPWRFS